MKFLVDADLPPSVALRLRELGYDCLHVKEIGRGTASDDMIYAAAQQDARVIISRDHAFANIARFPVEHHAGVVRIRAHGLRRDDLTDLITEFLRDWRGDLNHTLVILEPGYVRVRRA